MSEITASSTRYIKGGGVPNSTMQSTQVQSYDRQQHIPSFSPSNSHNIISAAAHSANSTGGTTTTTTTTVARQSRAPNFRNFQFFLISLLGGVPPPRDVRSCLLKKTDEEINKNNKSLGNEPVINVEDVIDSVMANREGGSAEGDETYFTMRQLASRAMTTNLHWSPFSPDRGSSVQSNTSSDRLVEWKNPRQQLMTMLKGDRRVVVVVIPFLSRQKLVAHLNRPPPQVVKPANGKRKKIYERPAFSFFNKFASALFPMENVYVWKSTRVCPYLSSLLNVEVHAGSAPHRDVERQKVKLSPTNLALKDQLLARLKRLYEDAQNIVVNKSLLSPCVLEEEGFFVPNENELKEMELLDDDCYHTYITRPPRKYGGKLQSFLVLGPKAVHDWFSDQKCVCSDLTPKDFVALDCEMFEVRGGIEAVGHVAMVDGTGEVLLDIVVKPPDVVTNYRQIFSGLTPEIIAEATHTLEDVQKKIIQLYETRKGRMVIVGHSVVHDMSGLKTVAPYYLDTSLLYRHMRSAQMKVPLRLCVRQYLGISMRETQTPDGHDPVEDALASCALCFTKLLTLDKNKGDTRVPSERSSINAPLAYLIPPKLKEQKPTECYEESFPGFNCPDFQRSLSTLMSYTPTLPRFLGGWRAGVHIYDSWPIPSNRGDSTWILNSKVTAPHTIDPRKDYSCSESLVESAINHINGHAPRDDELEHPFSCQSVVTDADDYTSSRLSLIMLRDFQHYCCETLGCIRNLKKDGLASWDADGGIGKGRHMGLFYGGGYNGRARRLLENGWSVDALTLRGVKSEQPLEETEGLIKSAKGDVIEKEETIQEICRNSQFDKMFPQTRFAQEATIISRIDRALEKIYDSLSPEDVLYVASGSGDVARYFTMETYHRHCGTIDPDSSLKLDKLLEQSTEDFRDPLCMTVMKK